MSRYQIKPLLHYNLSLTYQQDVLTARKQRKTTVRSLTVKDPLKISMNETVKDVSEIMKLSKEMKCVKTAKLTGSGLTVNDTARRSGAPELSKTLRRVESLSIRDVISEQLPLSLGTWLKTAKKLKKVGYIAREYTSNPDVKVNKKAKKAFYWLNRAKVRELNLQAGFSERISPFLFQKYPASLQQLVLSCPEFAISRPSDSKNPVRVPQSLSNLNQLKSLHFRICDTDGMIVPLLNSISDLSQLTTLELAFKTANSNVITHIAPFLDTLQKSNNLKKLYLSFSSPPEKLEDLFAAVKDCPLTDFKFCGHPANLVQWNHLLSFLSNLDHLESFRLEVPQLDSRKAPSGLSSTIEKLLTKPIKLHTFELDCPNQEGYFNFMELMNTLKETAPILKALQICVTQYHPSKTEFSKIMEFLKTLKQIESLDLGSVIIPGQECFEEIVSWCYSMKNLRVLRPGIVSPLGSTKVFAELIEKILVKKGLGWFDCTPSDWVARNEHMIKGFPYLDMKVVKRKNPSLQWYPEFVEMPSLKLLYF